MPWRVGDLDDRLVRRGRRRRAVQRERRSARRAARSSVRSCAFIARASCGKYLTTQRSDSAPPGRGRRSTRRPSPATAPSSSGWSHCGSLHQRRAPWRCRRGRACTGRTTRRRRTASGCAPRRARVSCCDSTIDRRRADEAAVRLQRVEVERDVGHRRRQDAARRAARQVAVERVARPACRRSIRRSARCTRDAGRREVHARLAARGPTPRTSAGPCGRGGRGRRTTRAPFSRMSRTQYSVSMLCSSVGRPNRPTCATYGGRRRGMPRLPSIDSIIADSSPQM